MTYFRRIPANDALQKWISLRGVISAGSGETKKNCPAGMAGQVALFNIYLL